MDIVLEGAIEIRNITETIFIADLRDGGAATPQTFLDHHHAIV